ncbi:hypothetical protein Misp02_36420 [Microtetraspora sp. NBRC 16547]|nr:hypothetical protein Misp02_36420 [Microtetraspora sp. NBRC 16547]
MCGLAVPLEIVATDSPATSAGSAKVSTVGSDATLAFPSWWPPSRGNPQPARTTTSNVTTPTNPSGGMTGGYEAIFGNTAFLLPLCVITAHLLAANGNKGVTRL